MIPTTAVADRLIKDIKEDDLTTKEIQDRVHTLAKKALAQAESEDSTEICNRLKHLIDTLKENYNFATRDDFITQVIDKVIQTCNTLSSENQLAPSLPAEALFTVIDHLPFSTKSDVEKVVAILKEIEPKGKPPPDVKNYHKHLMDSFIKKVNESAVPLKYFDEETLKWLVPKLSHLNLLGLEAGKFLDTYRPTNANTYSISATELAKLSQRSQQTIFPKISHFDLVETRRDQIKAIMDKATNAKSYTMELRSLAYFSEEERETIFTKKICYAVHHAVDLEDFSIEQLEELGPKIIDLKISEDDLSGEQFASLIENCRNLVRLTIRTNTDSLPQLPNNLEELICFNCSTLKTLPNNLQKLKKLAIIFSAIETLPENLQSLEELTCTNCPNLQELPNNLQSLEKLTCTNCLNLQALPNNLQNLKSLECSRIVIGALPNSLQNLETLACYICPLLTLPANLQSLKALRYKDCPRLDESIVPTGCQVVAGFAW